jgi:hypothetical protein
MMTHLRLAIYLQIITTNDLRTTSLTSCNIERTLEKLELDDQMVVQIIQPALAANAAVDTIIPFLLATVPPRVSNVGSDTILSSSLSDPFIGMLIEVRTTI